MSSVAPFRPVVIPARLAQFFDKVSPEPTSGCWLWTASTNSAGYGQINVVENGKSHVQTAHRVSYAIAHGSCPIDLTLDHKCRTPSCVNPRHLEPVTLVENILRAQTGLCHKGHDLSLHAVSWGDRCAICYAAWLAAHPRTPEQIARYQATARAKFVPKPKRTHCRRGHSYAEHRTSWGACGPCHRAWKAANPRSPEQKEAARVYARDRYRASLFLTPTTEHPHPSQDFPESP